MEEEKKNVKPGGDSVKLFVGQVPKHITEAQLLDMFQEFAIVDEVNIIKDKVTKTSRGCCFLICPSRQEADKAVNACHNKKTFPGASSPLQVKYADGELERLEHKLFVGMLPKNVSDTEVSTLFSKYGNIKDLQILRGSQHTSKGCAFLKYETKDQAIAALEAVNGKYKMEGSNVPLVVKWADTEKERQARKAQKAQASNIPGNSTQQPSLFGALPVGYVPQYNGFGYQAAGSYGLMQYTLSPMQNQSGYHSIIPPANQGNSLGATMSDLPTRIGPGNFTPMHSGSYLGSTYPPAIPGVQYPMAYLSNIVGQRSLGTSRGPVLTTASNSNSATTSTLSTNTEDHIGPPGANLFIYHIPQEFGDQELSNAFQPFGRVLSAKVYVDKNTGDSKCFGFVSYDSPAAAESAINVMNGCQLGDKKLKVQLKRDNRQSKPY